MKRFILILAAVMLGLSQLIAQESTFTKGTKVINLGIGIGSRLYTGSYYTSQVPPLSGSFEVDVKDGVIDKGSIGVGGYLGYSSTKWEYSGYGWKYSNIVIGPRGSFHYPLAAKLDTYTGLILGYNIASSTSFGSVNPGYNYSVSSGGLVVSWFVGARYYLKEKFALFGEVGFGITNLNLGVAFKI
jgi:hypothetical protein